MWKRAKLRQYGTTCDDGERKGQNSGISEAHAHTDPNFISILVHVSIASYVSCVDSRKYCGVRTNPVPPFPGLPKWPLARPRK
jgi:hypothetical protein